jgi:hypothetical protein
MFFLRLKCLLGLAGLLGFPALARPEISITNSTFSPWRVVNAFPSILAMAPATTVRFKTTVLEWDGRGRSRIHVGGVDAEIPPLTTVTIELLDRIYEHDPSQDGMLFYLKDGSGRHPGTFPHLDYRFGSRGEEAEAFAILDYYSPLEERAEEDRVVQAESLSSVKITQDSWQTVLDARAKTRGRFDRFLGFW